MRPGLTFVLLLAGCVASYAQPVERARVTAITGGTVVDVTSGTPLRNAVVLIEGNRITAIGPAGKVTVPPGADAVDASGKWLIPGLMNMHVHLGLTLPGREGAELANESDADLVLRMASNARKSLHAGVTTIRLPGDRRHADMALKRAIDRGEVEGPRMFSSGEMIPITGGHGSGRGSETYDGPYEIRRQVRREIAAGASWIKIAISSGIATPRGDIAGALMTRDEMEAVTDIARRHGLRVTAHSGSSAATKEAVDAGVSCIEHGYFLDRDVLRHMKEKGVWYVPTIVVSRPATMPYFERIGSPPWYLERVKSVAPSHWDALRTAIAEGVRIALGTDQFPYEPNDGTTATVREVEYYVEAGMSPLQALRSATLDTSTLLGTTAETGSLEVGKLADIVGLDGDPLGNIKALRTIGFVMKDGRVVRNDWKMRRSTSSSSPQN
jgi:imidazolonepropionase-like amidohydrolase